MIYQLVTKRISYDVIQVKLEMNITPYLLSTYCEFFIIRGILLSKTKNLKALTILITSNLYLVVRFVEFKKKFNVLFFFFTNTMFVYDI